MRLGFLLFALAASPFADAAEWITESVPRAAGTQPGSVWLRCYIRPQDNMAVAQEKDLWRDSVTLSFAEMPQPFTVLLNGQKIVESPAIGDTARRFKVPKGILEKGAFNTLVIVLPSDVALSRPPVLAGYFDELLLSGEWQKSTEAPAAVEMAALRAQPATAFFTEKQFRKSVTPLAATENMPGQRLSPAESLSKLQAGDGLIVEDLLHEPIVAQPTHLSFDERGRLWVSQYRQYPYPAGLKQLSRDMFYRAVFDRVPPAPPNHDRGADKITVHEDTDGDGFFDRHKTVLEGLNMANAALRGHGGIWVMHSPYLLFYPDKNGDDTPDGPPEVRLAGFGLEDTHSVANGLIWGPDGWLYGGQGSTVTSRITRPGTDSANTPARYYEGCMVWRYHPETREFEIFADGGGNTFGLEFDSEGRLYSGHNGGETRGWHFAQGGIYLKQGKDPGKFGPPTNPYALGEFNMMKSANPIQRFTHNIIVGEGTALPPSLRGHLLGADPLHRKITVSELVPAGPTFSTKDTGVALAGSDIAFRPVYLTNAPDGSVYIADFYEEFIAHGQNYQGQLDPSTGRVYRLRGKNEPLAKDTNLSTLSTSGLVAMLSHPNRWHRHTAVRLLGEKKDPAAIEPLKGLLRQPTLHPALEALWTLHQCGELAEPILLQALAHPEAVVRSWAIRLAGDNRQLPDSILAAITKQLATDDQAVVRSQAASTARRVPLTQALQLIRSLATRVADAEDPWIPLFCWWTLESHVASNRDAVLTVFADPAFSSTKLATQHLASRIANRLASPENRSDFLALATLIEKSPAPFKGQLVKGFEEAFQGRALPSLPEELAAVLANAGTNSREFLIRRGDAAAITESLAAVADAKRKPEERLRIIRALGEAKVTSAVPPLLAAGKSDARPTIRNAALNALLNFNNPEIAVEITASFAHQPAGSRAAAITLLASRQAWHGSFATLIERGDLKPGDIPTDVADRLRIDSKLAALLPTAPMAPDGNRRISEIKGILSKGTGNPYDGEKVFEQRCASCHQLFFKGGRIGPNLTAYQRDDLGTMLSSIVTPSAEIREGYQNVTITMKDGRVLGGFVADKDAKIVVLRGFDGQDTALPQAEIADLKAAGRSLMPDGLLDGLTDQQLRDFFAYLRIPQPISK